MPKTRLILALILSLLMALAISGCGSDADEDTDPVGDAIGDTADKEITVMTYNVYLGGDAESIFVIPPTDPALLSTIAQVYQQTVASDYQSRAEAIADSIEEHQPHLVGLQEITLMHSLESAEMPSVYMDFLPMLEHALGDEYRTVASVPNTEVVLPLLKGALAPEYQTVVPDDSTCPELALSGCLYVRTVFSDVMLARSDVEVSNIAEENYTATLPSPNPTLEATRGYVALDATVSGTTYRVVNTHLEAYDDRVTRKAQAEELMAVLEDETMPRILLGDFNSDANTDPPGEVYSLLTAADYEDVWQGGPDSGFTCCQDFDLDNEVSQLDERIDHIFVRNVDVDSAVTETVGDRSEDRVVSSVTNAEIWPSDHAGVVAELSIR